MMSHQSNERSMNDTQELCSLVIEKEWQIARARHHLKIIAIELGFNDVHTAQLVTSLSELGYNLIFHSTKGGIVYISQLRKLNAIGIKLICVDCGDV